ncbi:unnamed protein product [Caenorhabditis auriculariae]|uniref:CBS domain-containing protein n=1 Tax=Caenorhabditis auriculariae TaxID=2777116 RepID=A0A8S1HCX1_9PELO|nr:unnamed protein product [Caenorhabditis auriculariae]
MSQTSSGQLRRNKATNFHPVTIPKAEFNLQHHFIFRPDKAPKDGLQAIQREGDVISRHSIAKYAPEEVPDDVDESLKIDKMFKTVARLGINEPEMVYTHLLQLSQCYEAMARSNKVIVFTDDTSVRKAFNALIYNSVRTGLVADSKSLAITGVLSITDFIMVLMMLWKFRDNLDEMKGTPLSHEDFENMDVAHMPIRRWKELLGYQGQLKPFVCIKLNESLFRAVELLSENRIHRLPVMDDVTNDCAYILTHRRILHYIWKHCALLPKPAYLNERAIDIPVGTWNGLIYATERMPLIQALDMLIDNGISGMPVVEYKTLKILDVYTRFDTVAAAFWTDIDLSVTVAEAIKRRENVSGILRDGVVTANQNATMWELVQLFVDKNVHRIFMVDEYNCLKGLVSLSDITEYIVLRPATHHQKLRNHQVHLRTVYECCEAMDRIQEEAAALTRPHTLTHSPTTRNLTSHLWLQLDLYNTFQHLGSFLSVG